MGRSRVVDAGITVAAIGISTAAVRADDSAGFLEGVFLATLLIGLFVGLRSAARASRAAEMERVRLRRVTAMSAADAARTAVAEEQIRLAHDLGTVVRTSVTRMSEVADRAQQVEAEKQLSALLAIQEEGRRATSDLRRLLGLLRQPTEPPPPPPVPDVEPSLSLRYVDLAVGAATAALAVAEPFIYPNLPRDLVRSPLSFVLTAVAAGAVAGRRLDPGRSAVVCAAAFAVGAAAQHPVTGGLWMVVTLGGLMWACAARITQTLRTSIGMACLFGVVLGSLGWRDPGNVPIVAVIMVAGLVCGLMVRRNESRSRAANREASRREADLTAAATIAVEEQRRSVARAMHDLVSGAVGVMMMQAGAAEVRLRTDRDAGRQALEVVQQTAASALAELDELVPLLGDAPVGVRADVADHWFEALQALVDRLRAGGLQVSVDVEGDVTALTGTIATTTYRVVQETLTNVLRHAAGAQAAVRIEILDGQVTVEVHDDGPGLDPSARWGHGLTGLAERVHLAGGTVETDPASSAGGLRLTARIPLQASIVTT